MNVIFNDSDNSLRLVKYDSTENYSVDNIVFYVPTKYVGAKFFMMLTSGGKSDVVLLKQKNSSNANYYCYGATADSFVKIESGKCEMSLLGIGAETGEVVVASAGEEINFDNKKYNFRTAISEIENFSYTTAQMYRKMLTLYEQMSEMSKLVLGAIAENGGENK